MGCGGSKDAVVATEATISCSKNQTRQASPHSDLKPNAEKHEIDEQNARSKTDKPLVVPSSVSGVEDLCLEKEDEKVVEEAKKISKESPDRYFSSRKDEEMIEGVVAMREGGEGEGLEYYSPQGEAINDVAEEKKLDKEKEVVAMKEQGGGEQVFEYFSPQLEVNTDGGEGVEKEKEPPLPLKDEEKELVVGDEEDVASKEEDEKTTAKDEAEPVEIEEAKSEAKVEEPRNSTK